MVWRLDVGTLEDGNHDGGDDDGDGVVVHPGRRGFVAGLVYSFQSSLQALL